MKGMSILELSHDHSTSISRVLTRCVFKSKHFFIDG
eukprot:UN15574